MAGIGVLATGALFAWVPRTDDLRGGTVARELGVLRRIAVWLMFAVAASGISGIFAVYAFIVFFHLYGLAAAVVCAPPHEAAPGRRAAAKAHVDRHHGGAAG
ncbi:hypothetical protein ACWCQ1_40060 [Streptomyces sp. NPDC002144]